MAKKSLYGNRASSSDDDSNSWVDHGYSWYAQSGSSTNDLIVLDFESFAKGGPGGGGGGGNTGGTSVPNYISGAEGSYNIEIVFKGTWDDIRIAEAKQAADYITSYIHGDIQDVFFRGQIIDDLKITMEIGNIDGAGGVLGQAGVTAIRTGASTDAYLPATASIKFDIADVNTFGLDLDAIMLHEIMHSVGFGSVWSYFPTLTTGGTFNGTNAVNAYHTEFGTTGGVPIENSGGAGTAGSHWEEALFITTQVSTEPPDALTGPTGQIFGNEIMTGYIGPGAMYVADMTMASFADLGYELTVLTGFSDPTWV